MEITFYFQNIQHLEKHIEPTLKFMEPMCDFVDIHIKNSCFDVMIKDFSIQEAPKVILDFLNVLKLNGFSNADVSIKSGKTVKTAS